MSNSLLNHPPPSPSILTNNIKSKKGKHEKDTIDDDHGVGIKRISPGTNQRN
jgi:hypothetical protein